jgi:ADP-glucose pyrophosphorylase
VSKAILDEGCEVPEGTRIGFDLAEDAKRYHVTERGVVLVTPDMLQPAAPAERGPVEAPAWTADRWGNG